MVGGSVGFPPGKGVGGEGGDSNELGAEGLFMLCS